MRHTHAAIAAVLYVECAFLLAALLLPTAAGAQPPPPQPHLYLPLVQEMWRAPVPSTSQLIDAALARGEIDAETALAYKVFWTFGDARLPAAFRGDDHLVAESGIVAEVQARYATLSAATQALLDPFLIPPAYVGSWAEPAAASAGRAPAERAPAERAPGERASAGRAPDGPQRNPPVCGDALAAGWTHLDGAHVRVWWKTDGSVRADVAQSVVDAMEGTIWSKLTGLMGRRPLSDAGVLCSGGDGRLDIYLVPAQVRSYTAVHNPPGCRQTPAFIVFNPAASNGILAHEFMHTIQDSYATRDGCVAGAEYGWLGDATASWAQDYVYPALDEEHAYVDWFFSDTSTPSLELDNDYHEYGAYLFFTFLTHGVRYGYVIKDIWENTESHDSLEAINQALQPQGFAGMWAEFARANWNVPPFDFYNQWDGLTARAKPLYGDQTILGPGDWPMSSTVPHLGLLYRHYRFGGDGARLVTFFNGLTSTLGEAPMNVEVDGVQVNDGSTVYTFQPPPPEKVKGAQVQALYKIAGETAWRREDWTARPYVSFCRDARSERLEELVIIFSNSEYTRTYQVDSLGLPSRLTASDIGCWRYQGNASETSSRALGIGSEVETQVAQDVIFERRDRHPDIPYPVLDFGLEGGKLHRTYTLAASCTGAGSWDMPLSPGLGWWGSGIWTIPGAIGGPSVRRYLGSADSLMPLLVEVDCVGPPLWQIYFDPWFSPSEVGALLGAPFIVGADGSLAAAGTVMDGEWQIRYQWNFVPLREP